jgi:hypothetical protein
VSYYAAWHHLVTTFDGSQSTQSARQSLYIDGVAKTLTTFGPGSPTALASGMGNMMLARDISDNTYGAQSCTDFQVWTNTLTQVQVTAIYNKGPQQ